MVSRPIACIDEYFHSLVDVISNPKIPAKKIQQKREYFLIFGALDGLNISYTTIKYLCDLSLSDSNLNSSDVFHEWLDSPYGLAFIIFGTPLLMALSAGGNYFKDDDLNRIKKSLAIIWAYGRHLFKGLKNAYKGARSMVQVLGIFQDVDLRYVIKPVAIPVGVAAVLGRLAYQYITDKRKGWMDDNQELKRKIKNITFSDQDFLALGLSEDKYGLRTSQRQADISAHLNKCGIPDPENYLAKTLLSLEVLKTQIKYQDRKEQIFAYCISAYNGLVDGLYINLGIVTLVGFLPFPFLIILAMVGLTFTLAFIACRVYTEFDYQRKLEMTQEKDILALTAKRLELYLNQYLTQSQSLDIPENEEKLKTLQGQIHFELDHFLKSKQRLQQLYTPSLVDSFFVGMQNGLCAYGAISSFIFGSVTLLALISIQVSIFVILPFIGIGILAFGVCILHSMYKNYQFRCQLANTAEIHPLFSLSQKQQQLNWEALQNIDTDAETITNAIRISRKIKKPPTYFISEWSEVFRCFFSGSGKGSKAVLYLFNTTQQLGEDGHYHDSLPIVVLAGCSALIHALMFAIRAYARGFGRNQPGKKVKKLTPELTDAGEPTNGELMPPNAPGPEVLALDDTLLIVGEQEVDVSIDSPLLSDLEDKNECKNEDKNEDKIEEEKLAEDYITTTNVTVGSNTKLSFWGKTKGLTQNVAGEKKSQHFGFFPTYHRTFSLPVITSHSIEITTI